MSSQSATAETPVFPKQSLAPLSSNQGQTSVSQRPQETYRWIVLMGDEDNLSDVTVLSNGIRFFIRRNEPVVLPASIIKNCLMDAVAPTYITVPGGMPLPTKPHMRYKLSDKGEATEEEFQKLLAEKRVLSREPMPRVTVQMRLLQRAMSNAGL